MSSLDEELRIIEALGRAIRSVNSDQLREDAYNLDTHLINVGSFSPTLFRELVNLFSLPEFLTMEGSLPVLKIFQDSFDYLTGDQKEELLRVLETCYQDLTDPTSLFLVSEIIGESYCDERALETLRRLKASKADVPRSLVPHGLEYFARKCGDRELATLAFNELLQMRSDLAENVRDEAITSLNQLARHGWPPSNESPETKSLDP